MSTIKTTHLQHPSAASPNLTLAADGSVSGGAGLGGLVHIATESFSGVSSVSLDNVFTNTYTDYKIVMNILCSTTADIHMVFRLSGADQSSGYYWQRFTANGTTTSATSNGNDSFINIGNATPIAAGFTLDIYEPNVAGIRTRHSGHGFSDSGSQRIWQSASQHVGSDVDGVKFLAASGNISGSIQIYGYANS